MGLLERFLGTAKVDPKEEKIVRALIAVPMIVATADRKIEVAEMDALVGICFEAPLLKDRPLEENHAVAEDILKTIKAEGPQGVWDEIKANLPPELHETALRYATRMAAADGEIPEVEFETLKRMAQGFGMTPEHFMAIFNASQTLEHVRHPTVH